MVACVVSGATTSGLLRVLGMGKGMVVRSTTVRSGEEWGGGIGCLVHYRLSYSWPLGQCAGGWCDSRKGWVGGGPLCPAGVLFCTGGLCG